MTGADNMPPRRRRWPDGVRWGLCFVLAFVFHAAGAAALLARWNDTTAMPAGAPVVMIDLAPVAAAPDTTPKEVPPETVESKEQIEPDPTPEQTPEPLVEKIEKVELEPDLTPEPEKPIEKLDLPPIPQAEVTLPVMPPEKPQPKRRQASVERTKSAADRRAERAAAPMPSPSSRDSNAVPNWKSMLVSQLERYKRYPSEAQSRGDTGVAQLAFSVDRSGGVHNARIVRSSGSSLLDRETLALVQRAQPLPPPPPEMGQGSVSIVVPIRYNMR